ncbi:hypothetical protein KCV04_g13, partial [Aureobasidium melanogenum]
MRRRRLSQSTTNTGRQSAIGTIIESRYSKEKSACCVIGLGVIGRRQLAFYRTCTAKDDTTLTHVVRDIDDHVHDVLGNGLKGLSFAALLGPLHDAFNNLEDYDLDFGVVCGLLLRAPSQWCGGCLMRRRGLWTRVMNKEAWGTLCCREGDGYE